MCNIDRKAEAQLLAMGLNLITKAMEAAVRENRHSSKGQLSKTRVAGRKQKPKS